MKVVVTGGAGFIGSHLVEELAAIGCEDVWVIDNLHRGSIDYLGQLLHSDRVTFIKGDIRDRTVLRRVFERGEVVFHLAAQSNVLGSVRDPDYAFTTNVVGTYNVLREAVEAGVRRVVFTSSREVYGEPASLPVKESAPLAAKNPYAASKIAGEAYCQAFAAQGLEVVILRLANIYGPRDTDRVIPLFIQAMLHNEKVKIYGEAKVLDFIWVGEVVQVLMTAGLHEDWVRIPVNVGSGLGIGLIELANELASITHSSSQIRAVPSRDFEVSEYTANVTRMHAMFGHEPNGNPLDHLEEVVGYWRERGKANCEWRKANCE